MPSKDKHLAKIEKLKAQKQVLQKENRRLKSKLRDVEKSRAHWKAKARRLQAHSCKSSQVSSVDIFAGTKAKHHSYSLLLVAFCANIQAYGAMSLRACVHVLFCLQLAFGEQKRLPSYSSIRVWVCKLGKYRIENQEGSPAKWVYWIDESIHVGNDKILLVLGCAEKDLDFKTSLDLSKLRVLHMEISSQWKGEQIATILEGLQAKFPLAYVVSDGGNNLKKSYKIASCLAISDCTHILSKGIEKCYKGTEIFEDFCHFAGALRKKWALNASKKPYLPPNQRNKVRFANLFPLVQWAKVQLEAWETLPSDVQAAFDFLDKHKQWVLDFWKIQEQVVAISLILKIEGYSRENELMIKKILGTAKREQDKIFSQEVLSYLMSLSEKIGTREKLYCCSDVIESAFGKVKQKLGKNSPQLSAFIFSLASIGGQYRCEEVQKALESIREKDIGKQAEKTSKNGRNGEPNSPFFVGKIN